MQRGGGAQAHPMDGPPLFLTLVVYTLILLTSSLKVSLRLQPWLPVFGSLVGPPDPCLMRELRCALSASFPLPPPPRWAWGWGLPPLHIDVTPPTAGVCRALRRRRARCIVGTTLAGFSGTSQAAADHWSVSGWGSSHFLAQHA